MEQSLSPINLAQKKVTVLGAGRSGVAAAKQLKRLDADVLVSDANPILPDVERLLHQHNIQTECNGHSDAIYNSALIIVSPGIPWDTPVLQQARQKDIPIWGELELGYRLCPSKNIIAITGTNGKSTTTRLIAALLEAQNIPVVMGGNLGTPFCDSLDQINKSTWVVLEVSSFQLESVQHFNPCIGVWLNLTPDHLDRHGDMAHYRALKTRLFERQRPIDHAVLGPDIQLPSTCMAQQHRALSHFMDLPKLFPHQRENLAAALTTTRLIMPDSSPDRIDLKSLLNRPHSLESLSVVGDVHFYNDSKATNPQATITALEALRPQRPLCLILGGDHKGIQDNNLGRYLSQAPHVEQIIFIGDFDAVWQSNLGDIQQPFQIAQDFDEALSLLSKNVQTCLLSPAAASFDRYPNYLARGDAFCEAVEKLR